MLRGVKEKSCFKKFQLLIKLVAVVDMRYSYTIVKPFSNAKFSFLNIALVCESSESCTEITNVLKSFTQNTKIKI